MNNQKEYKIIINGLQESVANVDELLKVLDKLEGKIKDLSNKSIKISTDTPTKIDIPKVDASSYQELTKELQEQLVLNQKLKEQQKEQKQLIKDIANGVKDEEGNYTNTLGGMRKQLAEMKKELSSMDISDEGFLTLKTRIKELNDEVLNIEKSYGTFTRQVGNYELVNGINGAVGAVQDLRGEIGELSNNPIKLNIGSAVTEFNNAKEAGKLLKGEMQELAAKMYELEKSGQGSSEEFKNLQARFNDVASAGDQLEHITNYADRMSKAIKDDSGAVGELARTFDAFSSVAQVGVGLMGLFGSENEKAEEAINRTVQVMTTLKGIQEIVNTQFQKGAPLMNIWNKALEMSHSLTRGVATSINVLSTSLGIEGVAATEATVATTAFDTALAASGIGAIIIAIGSAIAYLVTNFDDLKAEFKALYPEITELEEEMKPLISVFQAVGKAIVDGLLAPVHAVLQLIHSIKEGKNIIQASFDSLGVYIDKFYGRWFKIGDTYSKQEKKRLKSDLIEKKKKLAEELKYQIDMNIAKYGNDWKYTQQGLKLMRQYWKLRVEIAKNGTREELQAANIELTQGERDIKVHQEKITADALAVSQKMADDAKKTAQERSKALADAEKEIRDNRLAIMKDGLRKEVLILNQQRDEEIAKAKERGVKVQEVIQSINDKYNQLIADKTNDYAKSVEESFKRVDDAIEKMEDRWGAYLSNMIKVNQYASNRYKALADDTISPLTKFSEETEGAYKKLYNLNPNIFNIKYTELIKYIQNGAKELPNIIGKQGQQIADNLTENILNGYKLYDEFRGLYAETLLGIENEAKKKMKSIGEGFVSDYGDAIEKIQGIMKNADLTPNDLGGSWSLLLSELETFKKIDFENASLKDLTEVFKNIEKDFELFDIDRVENEIVKAQALYERATDDITRNEISARIGAFEQIKELIKRFNDDVIDLDLHLYSQILLKEYEAFEEERKIAQMRSDFIIQVIKKQYDELTKIRDDYESNNKESIGYGADIDALKEIGTRLASNAKIYKQMQLIGKATDQEILSNQEDIEKQEKKIKDYYEFSKKEGEKYNRWVELKTKQKNGEELTVNEMEEWFMLEKVASKTIEEIKLDIENAKLIIIDDKKNIEALQKVKDGVDETIKKTQLSFKDIMNIAVQMTSVFGEILGNISEISYNNEKARIDREKELLEKELEMLEEQFARQEELYNRHNERVNEIEGSLTNARGDRRLALIDQLNAEVWEREQAWNEEQRINKEKEANEKKQKMLEEREKQIEKKRRKEQQKIDIMQAIANTALGVTNALRLQPIVPLGVAMAALVGALGATEIATIASQKFADGGLLNGKSHSQGGMKIEGTNMEVEGNEFVVNKKSTQANLPLISYINQKRGAVSISEIEEVLNSKNPSNTFNIKSKYKNGGVLPSINVKQMQTSALSQQPNQEIWVSVAEIESVQKRMANVREIAGDR